MVVWRIFLVKGTSQISKLLSIKLCIMKSINSSGFRADHSRTFGCVDLYEPHFSISSNGCFDSISTGVTAVTIVPVLTAPHIKKRNKNKVQFEFIQFVQFLQPIPLRNERK